MVQENLQCVSERAGGREAAGFPVAPLPALRFALQPGPPVGPCRCSRVSTDPPRQTGGQRDPEQGPQAGSGGTTPCSTRESRWRAESGRFPLFPEQSPGRRIGPAAPSVLLGASRGSGREKIQLQGRERRRRALLAPLHLLQPKPSRAAVPALCFPKKPLSASPKAALCFPKSTKLSTFGICKLLRL